MFTHLVLVTIFRQALPLQGELLTLRRHHHSSIPNSCSGTALPGDPHQHQGPPRHGAALYLWKGNDVAPSPHQATNHQQAALAKFMGRLEKLKSIKSQSCFTLELGNQRSSRAQHPMQAQPTPPSASWGLLRCPQWDPASPGSPSSQWCCQGCPGAGVGVGY